MSLVRTKKSIGTCKKKVPPTRARTRRGRVRDRLLVFKSVALGRSIDILIPSAFPTDRTERKNLNSSIVTYYSP